MPKAKTGDLRQIETRYRHCPPELRAEGATEGPDIKGHAAVFNQEAIIGGLFREKIDPSAFNKTVTEFDTRLLLQHDSRTPLARRKNNTLVFGKDDVGLPFEANLPNTSYGNDTRENVRTGLLDAMSFGFVTIRDEWPDVPDGQLPLRILLEVGLREISIVTWPAYDGTDVIEVNEARSILDAHNERRQESESTEEPDNDERVTTPTEPEPNADDHSIAGSIRTAQIQREIDIAFAEIEDLGI